MATYLLTWNPRRFDWESLDRDLKAFRDTGVWSDRWSCGNRKNISPDDRVFLVKQGPQLPRGIFASGYVIGGVKEGPHFTDPKKSAFFIDVDFDVFLDPRREVLPRSLLDKKPYSAVNWGTQAGGIEIPSEVADRLEGIWFEHVVSHGLSPEPPSLGKSTQVVLPTEGGRRAVTTTRLERSSAARRICLERKGFRCTVCDMDFGERYGAFGKGFIHVHHQTPLATRGGSTKTDPVRDLVPVCPNCHAMLHRQNPPVAVAALKRRINKS